MMCEEKTLCDKINENCDSITAICNSSDKPCTCGFVVNIRQYAGELELAAGTEQAEDEIIRLKGCLHGSQEGRKTAEKKIAALQEKYDKAEQDKLRLFKHNFEEVQRREKFKAALRELNNELSAALDEVARLEGANGTLEAQLDESRICRRRSEARLRSLANTLKNWGV